MEGKNTEIINMCENWNATINMWKLECNNKYVWKLECNNKYVWKLECNNKYVWKLECNNKYVKIGMQQ
jgi:hypothetical protein